MDAKTYDKKRLPGRHVAQASERAPAELIGQPVVGRVACRHEAASCNISPMHAALSVRTGVAGAGGMPRRQIMEWDARNVCLCDIMTHPPIKTAATTVAASRGSISAALRLPAIAQEAGIEFAIFGPAGIFKKSPSVADLKPRGRYVAKDMYDVGGMPVLLKVFLEDGFLDGDGLTVTRRAPAGAVCDAVLPEEQDAIRPARCFDDEEDAFRSVDARDLQVPDGGPAKRRASWKAPDNPYQSGVLWKYAQQVGPARMGAVTHPGTKKEVICYADQ